MTTTIDAVRALYSGDPGDFVARRKALAAQARADGDRDAARDIAALRKPTAAAAAVNHLDDDAVRDVLALGQEMRAAQTRLDPTALKELTTRRQRLLQEIVTRHALNGAIAEAVHATLLAAVADREAADAVASRTLVRPLRYSGWGDVDLTDAVAHRDAATRPALRLVPAPEPDDAEHAEAERVQAERRQAERAEAERRELEARIERLTVRLGAAQAAYDAALAARDAARAALDAALLMRSSTPGGTSSSSSS